MNYRMKAEDFPFHSPQPDYTKKAAALYHTLYPSSNFYAKRFDFQREFIKRVKELT